MAVSEYELTRMAEEEMDLARRLSWKELIRVTPWSDTYMAVSGAGLEVEMQRTYLWADDTREAIRVEIIARSMHAPRTEVLEVATVTPKGFE
jgi:hypothetical protein